MKSAIAVVEETVLEELRGALVSRSSHFDDYGWMTQIASLASLLFIDCTCVPVKPVTGCKQNALRASAVISQSD